MPNYYVSQDRCEELKKELGELKTQKRIEVAERLKRAKEYGDLSENSEYSEAKEEQAQVEGKIMDLENMLKSIIIIKKTGDVNEVGIGSTVTVSKDGKEYKYQIVGSNEAKPEEGKISNESPIGSVLLGKKVGDTAMVQAPMGKTEYKILGIE